jgi:hypothetical protein
MSYKSWVTVLQLQFFSTVLQGAADSENPIIFLDVGDYLKQSDRGTFSASTLYHFLQALNLPYQSLQVLREVNRNAFRRPW